MLDSVNRAEITVLPPAGENQRSHIRTGGGKNFTKLHGGVIKIFFAIHVIMLLIMWMTFGHDTEAAFAIIVCAVYIAMYFGTPYVMLRAGGGDLVDDQSLSGFLAGTFETWTGRISGREAMIQVCLIPGAIALAMAGISIVILVQG